MNLNLTDYVKKDYKMKTKGFTLAEVLITLAIVGVVAAITIPILVNKYQKQAQYTAFMKAFSSLSNAMSLAETEYDEPNNWSLDTSNRGVAIKTYIFSGLKTTKICDDSDITKCFPSYSVKFLNGDAAGTSGNYFKPNGQSAILRDGSIIGAYPYGSASGVTEIEFSVDINGTKGPNTIGRDIFMLDYGKQNNEWGFNFIGDFDFDKCNVQGVESAQMGVGCAARLLQEGKMNY